MTAMRETTPIAPPSPAAPHPGGHGGARRPGRATRQVGAAGQARRSAQRDLARREASLRINRRVSGPAGGAQRPETLPPQPQAAPVVQPPLAQPAPVRPQPATEPPLEPASFVAAPGPAAAPRRQPPAPRPQAAAPATPQPRRRASQPLAMAVAAAPAQPRPRAAQPQAVARPAAAMAAPAPSLPRPLSAAANAAAALPSRLPISLPARPKLIALPGGLVETAPTGTRRLSAPAVFVTAVTIIVFTVGCILGLQIRKTQLNERMGTELGLIQQTQQAVTRQQEQNSQLAAGAKIAGYSNGRLIQPDVKDVTFVRSGSRAVTAAKAADVLRRAPKALTDAELAAAAAGAQTASGTGATATSGGSATMGSAVTTTQTTQGTAASGTSAAQ